MGMSVTVMIVQEESELSRPSEPKLTKPPSYKAFVVLRLTDPYVLVLD